MPFNLDRMEVFLRRDVSGRCSEVALFVPVRDEEFRFIAARSKPFEVALGGMMLPLVVLTASPLEAAAERRPAPDRRALHDDEAGALQMF